MDNINCLSVLFCGDFSTYLRWNNIEPNMRYFENIINFVNKTDFSFLSVESSFTNRGKEIRKDGPNLRTKPEWLKVIKGIDNMIFITMLTKKPMI